MNATPYEQIRMQLAIAEWAMGEMMEGETGEDYREIAERRFALALAIAKQERASLVNSQALSKAAGKA